MSALLFVQARQPLPVRDLPECMTDEMLALIDRGELHMWNLWVRGVNQNYLTTYKPTLILDDRGECVGYRKKV